MKTDMGAASYRVRELSGYWHLRHAAGPGRTGGLRHAELAGRGRAVLSRCARRAAAAAAALRGPEGTLPHGGRAHAAARNLARAGGGPASRTGRRHPRTLPRLPGHEALAPVHRG